MKTRDLILQRTFALLLDKGYDGVSVSDIQQELEIARGLLYHYFGSKEELFAEAVRQKAFPLVAVDREKWKGSSIGEWIVEVVRHYEEVVTVLREEAGAGMTWMNLYFLIYQSARYHASLARELRGIHETLFAVWKAAVLNSFARGELKSGLNLESLARQFVCLTQGVSSINASDSDGRYDLKKGLYDFWEIIKR